MKPFLMLFLAAVVVAPVITRPALAADPLLIIPGEDGGVAERKSGRCQGGEPRVYKPGCGG